uniref:Secreted protein n=1 Tax=Rousettus aegyptiacus TaxID=9407 RepID=A0A7J8DXF3_ROUAE|nr:hypothetical protein HJG63_008338 [Rousettus aegyptiacus]
MAATRLAPAACVSLPSAAVPALLPGAVAAAPTEPGPEPPGWPAAAPPGTSRPHDTLPPGEHLGHPAPTSPGFPGVLWIRFHSIPILRGHPHSKRVAPGYPWWGRGRRGTSPPLRNCQSAVGCTHFPEATPRVSPQLMEKGRSDDETPSWKNAQRADMRRKQRAPTYCGEHSLVQTSPDPLLVLLCFP